MPTVSVILPTRNRVEFLEGAVESVFDQTYADLECVVVDGGSTDGTARYLEAVVDDRLRVVRHDEPQGLSAARNAGLDIASGEYVVFLDDDDRLHEDAVETLVETLEARPADCAGVYAAQGQVDDGERTVESVPAGRAERFDTQVGGPSATIVRADVIEAVGDFDESFPALEDQEFWIRVFAEYAMFGLDRVLYERHVHGEQMTEDPELMLSGNRRILEKHGEDLSSRTRADRHYGVAHQHARLGQPARARSHVRRAVREHPWRLAFVYYHGWLLLGTTGYRVGWWLHQLLYRPVADRLEGR